MVRGRGRGTRVTKETHYKVSLSCVPSVTKDFVAVERCQSWSLGAEMDQTCVVTTAGGFFIETDDIEQEMGEWVRVPETFSSEGKVSE